ncbi:hypothetical protein COLO4_32502 [Corchorus olitorius]|uniref:Rhodopsin n=1 Tax=Corchorus olitorius TaxID=93759 RepID=A0A1R3GZD4_9ROSI|nr:hypothetical protein COLO4_32502 [Corchorus olitorius]
MSDHKVQTKGYPPEGYPKDAYPPPGYPPQGYPQGYPPQGYPPQYAPQYAQPPPPQQQQSSGFLEGCLAKAKNRGGDNQENSRQQRAADTVKEAKQGGDRRSGR